MTTEEARRFLQSVFDRLFDPGPHDHMGVVLAADGRRLRVAEGNVGNLSAVLERERNSHIRGYIRIPQDYRYEPTCEGER